MRKDRKKNEEKIMLEMEKRTEETKRTLEALKGKSREQPESINKKMNFRDRRE